ncbi:MAG TPA: dockerin type I domain-containing protein, partial [Phycisphaerae bacterium]
APDHLDDTYPGSQRRLDYIWRSDMVTVVGAEVYDSADEGYPGGLPKYGNPLPPGTSVLASDHLMVFADVLIPSVPVPGDLNDDGMVDLADYAILRNCLMGPQVPVASSCTSSDLDQDADVDLRDAGQLFTLFASP